MKKYHEVAAVRVEGDQLRLSIDGKDHSFSISSISTRLADASQMEREVLQVSPSGYGIHWPLIDEDLSIDGLLGIVHRSKAIKGKISA